MQIAPRGDVQRHAEKATSKPIRDARYTLAALEWDVVREIGRYHDKRHDALGMTPRQAWDKAFASQSRLAPSLPTISPELFVIDFMPRIERQVNRRGIEYGGGGRFYWGGGVSGERISVSGQPTT